MTDEFEGCDVEVIETTCDIDTAMFIDMHTDDDTFYQVQYGRQTKCWTCPLELTGARAFIMKHDETIARIKFIIKSRI